MDAAHQLVSFFQQASPIKSFYSRSYSHTEYAFSRSRFPVKVVPCALKMDHDIPEISVEGDPFHLGLLIGRAMEESIHNRLAKDVNLYSNLLPFCKTENGSRLLEHMSLTNKSNYPKYWEELKGIAEGSNVPFIDLLVLNLRKEIGAFIPDKTAKELVTAADQCSDLMVCNEASALVGHNEDADSSVLGHAFFVNARLENGFCFTAYTYAGELPSCAFGFNQNGVAFSLNAVPPLPSEVDKDGIGRNFVSRDLLEAVSMEDALQRVTMPKLAFGHNYNIMDFRSREIMTIEVASHNRACVLHIRNDVKPYFHANIFSRLKIPQRRNMSSIHRLKRADEMLNDDDFECNVSSILEVLGDTKDENYPIYMFGNVYETKGPCLVTLCTALFDLDQNRILIFSQNPKLHRCVRQFDIVC